MDKQFEPLATGEVLSVNESAVFLIGHRTFRVGEFADKIREQLEYGISGWSSDKDAWFSEDGIPCEVLRFTANGWQKGKVRINLEFCPQDFEDDEENVSASVDDKLAPPQLPTLMEDELDLVESSSSSASSDVVIALGPPVDIADELYLVEPQITMMEVELDLVELPTSVTADELNLVESPTSVMEDEFELGTPAASDLELEQEAPSTIYVEMEQETSTIDPDDELDMTQMSMSFDEDEFDLGEISESIEQELELVEAPMASDEELLDLGEVSSGSDDDLDFGEMSSASDDDLDFGEMSSGSDDDLDFGEISISNEEDFQFGDFSQNNDLEENDTDSLLDDVWQDMNQTSWRNNQ